MQIQKFLTALLEDSLDADSRMHLLEELITHLS